MTDSPTSAKLLHLCAASDWAATRGGTYRPSSLDEVGFIHLSAPDQVHLPANAIYAGRDDVVVLVIDPALLDAQVRWEPGVDSHGNPDAHASILFPHLYGELPVAAVVEVRAYRPDANGRFATAEL